LSEFFASAALLIGAFFMLVASLGLVRFPDLYTRMHCATKATTFGMGGILIAVALTFGSSAVAAQSILALFFLFLTAPVSGHLISRAAYRRGPNLAPSTTVDDYGPYLEKEKAIAKTADEEKSDEEDEAPSHPSAGLMT
jgi:multicomponent Na+:H+ antiporter subunit G